jgi:hypothetical protein
MAGTYAAAPKAGSVLHMNRMAAHITALSVMYIALSAEYPVQKITQQSKSRK